MNLENVLKDTKYFLEIDKDAILAFEVDKLQSLIQIHSDLYYNAQSPIISDYEYDQIFKKLQFVEQKYNLSHKQTENVGSKVVESSFTKVVHSRPMISLDNTYNNDDLIEFDQRVKRLLGNDFSSKITYALQYKFD